MATSIMEARAAPLGQYNYQRNYDANANANAQVHTKSSRSSSSSNKGRGDGGTQLIPIEEVRKSKEIDEVTGMPKYTSVHRYLRGKMLVSNVS